MQTEYYAVIFTNQQTTATEGYSEMADKMEALAKEQPGYLGMDHARSEISITISYWETLEDIRNWKEQVDHQIAQKTGREKWYAWYKTRICKVNREYSFDRNTTP